MTLAKVDALARFCACFERLVRIDRVQDMVLRLTLDHCHNPELQAALNGAKSFDLYLSMVRGKSYAYTSKDAPLSPRHYNAPFDIALSKLHRSKILSSTLYDDDRILRLELLQQGSYKQSTTIVQFEFSGKHTNVIILNASGVVIEALRHISQAISCRPVKVGIPLAKMPPNPRPKTQESSIALESMPDILARAYELANIRALESMKHSLLIHYTRIKSRAQVLLESLPKAQSLLLESTKLQHQANLALMHLHTLKPYQTQVEIADESGELWSITLPSHSTPQAAINQLFKESKKLSRKAKNIHKEVANLEEKISFLDRELAFIERANKLDTLTILLPKAKQNTKKKSQNEQAEVVFIQGIKISIGRNERENIKLLESARADDLWLHIRDLPSSHLIIHCGKNTAPESVVYKAGEILLGVSGFKQGDFCVDYTKRKFVKIISGAQVVYSKHKSLHYRIS